MFRLFMLLLTAGVLGEAPNEKCKGTDNACVLKLANKLYTMCFTEEYGVDPMRLDVIEGNLSILKYKFLNVTAVGYKDCQVESATIDFEKLELQTLLMCPHLMLDGKYQLKGRLIVLPIEGSGEFKIDAHNYQLKINMKTEMKADEGKTSLQIKSYTVDAESLGGIKFAFDNLFNGNKELSDTVHKYANENWKDVAVRMQGPFITAEVKKLITVTNKLLKKIALEDYVAF